MENKTLLDKDTSEKNAFEEIKMESFIENKPQVGKADDDGDDDDGHADGGVDSGGDSGGGANNESNNSNMQKNIFCSLLAINYIVLIVCIGLSIADIVTDIILSIKYYNGFDHNCLKVNSNLTVHSNLTVDKSSIDRPAHPKWFCLTLFFIVLPCGIRILTIKTVDLHRNYFSCFGKRKKFLPKNWATKFLFKLLLVLILPILVIINQFRQLPLLLKIHQEKERLQTTEKQSTCLKSKSFSRALGNYVLIKTMNRSTMMMKSWLNILKMQ